MAEKDGKRLVAQHLTDGHNHAAFVKELRVMLMPDSTGWFAKSLEIDYEACGATLDEVKKNFAEGLIATIHEHLETFGNLQKVIIAANKEMQDEYSRLSPDKIQTESLSFLTVVKDSKVEKPAEIVKSIPFDAVKFIQPKQVALEART